MSASPSTTIPVLATATPSALGIDAAGVLAFVDALEGAEGIEPHSLMILRHGQVAAAGWWAPYAQELPHLLYSLSKSFTATALGLAVAEGLVDLDAPVVSYFPELDAEITDPRSRSILVRHVASMASGHTTDMIGPASAADPRDLVRGFLLQPPPEPPGSVFAYNQPCTFTVGAIVARTSGASLTEYLRPRLFDPLGITDAAWQRDASGRDLAYSGLHAPTEAIAKLGLLYQQAGVWNGEVLLDPAWVEAASSVQVATTGEENPDWAQGYGFQFWRARHGAYRGDGAFGQYALVLPEQGAVVAVTSATMLMQDVLDLVWEHLLPAFGEPAGGPARSDADAQLADRLERLALPAVPVGCTAAPAAQPGAPERWAATFSPAGGRCADQPTLVGLELALAAHGSAQGWQVTLVDGDERLTADLAADDWTVTELTLPGGQRADTADGALLPLALTGGWVDAETLRLDVVILETPHRLLVTAHAETATFEARWVTPPLHGVPLSGLRSPRRRSGGAPPR